MLFSEVMNMTEYLKRLAAIGIPEDHAVIMIGDFLRDSNEKALAAYVADLERIHWRRSHGMDTI